MISNFRLALVVLVPLFTATAAVSQTIWHAPKGKSVMVDGTVEQGEWDDALVKDLVGLARIRIKRSEEYVFFAVELLNSDDGALDLYVSPSPGEIYDLHASAKFPMIPGSQTDHENAAMRNQQLTAIFEGAWRARTCRPRLAGMEMVEQHWLGRQHVESGLLSETIFSSDQGSRVPD